MYSFLLLSILLTQFLPLALSQFSPLLLPHSFSRPHHLAHSFCRWSPRSFCYCCSCIFCRCCLCCGLRSFYCRPFCPWPSAVFAVDPSPLQSLTATRVFNHSGHSATLATLPGRLAAPEPAWEASINHNLSEVE